MESLHAGSESQEFLDLVLDCFLIHHIRELTRGDNVLDLVFSSIECMIGNVEVREPFSSSDHNIITFDLLYDSLITTWEEYYLNYIGRNYNEMDKSQQSVAWDAPLFDNNVSKKWAILKEVLDNAVSKFVPRSKRRTRQKPLWWT